MNISQYESLQFEQCIYTMDKITMPPKFPTHWHKYVEIIAFPKSDDENSVATVMINQTMHTLHSGDVLIVWPGKLHSIESNSTKLLVGIQFPYDLISERADFAQYLYLYRTYNHISYEETPQFALTMNTYLNHILDLDKQRHNFYDTEMLICLYEMFIAFSQELSKRLDTEPAPGSVNNNTLEKINIACNYIAHNCDQPLSLDDLATHMGFSSCYFSRIFKQITTYNFVEYLSLQRVKRAQSLLADTSLSITEISYQSGFKSISTFNRVFRQYGGCSPSDFRSYYTKS